MKKLLIALMVLILGGVCIAADTKTPNYNMTLPGTGSVGWLNKFNNNFSTLDTKLNEIAAGVPVSSLEYGTPVLGLWTASPSGTITDHGDTAQAGSIAATINTISTSEVTLRLPAGNYQFLRSYTIPANVHVVPDKGAIIDNHQSVRTASYKWTNSTGSEYYLELAAGGNPLVRQPTSVYANSLALTAGTKGSLSAGEWAWASTGSYNTIYIRLADSTDPDTKAVDYVQAWFTLTINSFSSGPYQVFSVASTVTFGKGATSQYFFEWFGSKGDGATDDSAAMIATIASLPSTGGTIRALGRTYEFASSVTFNKRIQLVGSGWNLTGADGATTFRKSDSLAADGFLVTSEAVTFENFGMYGETGNTGNGITVSGSGFTGRNLEVMYMGGAGIQIGDASDAAVNCNHWLLDQCRLRNNGSHGLYLISGTFPDAANANAGMASKVDALANGGAGIYSANAWANTFLACTVETNAVNGLHFADGARFNTVLGGDLNESNTGVIVQLDSGANFNLIMSAIYSGLTRFVNNGDYNRFDISDTNTHLWDIYGAHRIMLARAGANYIAATDAAGTISFITAGKTLDAAGASLTLGTDKNVQFHNYLSGFEVTEPAAPAANYGRIYFKDNGAGKTQLCVRFATGAVQVLATEP